MARRSYNLGMAREALRCDVCAVRDHAACAALDPVERRELAKLGHQRRLKRGESLASAGDPSELSATLTKGVLKVSTFDEDGAEHIVSLIHPAGFAGELFSPTVSHDVIALTDCELCVFPRNEYERALELFPSLSRAMLRRSSEALDQSRSFLAVVTRRSAAQRVAGFLLALSRAANDRACNAAPQFDLVLTRGEIASLLGLTIETVSRQLTKMERVGAIRKEGLRRVKILDAPHLEQLAG